MCENTECRCGGQCRRSMKENRGDEIANDLAALEFCDKVIAGLRAAEVNHPHAGFSFHEQWDETDEKRLDQLRSINDAHEEHKRASWGAILCEELYELRYELACNRFSKARDELVDIAVVALRNWLWTRDEEKRVREASEEAAEKIADAVKDEIDKMS